MTPDQISAIRARLDAATPGPWEAVTPKRYAAVRSEKAGCYVYTQGKIPADTHADTVTRQQRDAHLIANAPTDLRALLNEVERLTAWQVAVADGLGYLNRAEGQGGYEVAEPETVIGAWREHEREVERLTAEQDAAFARGAEAMRNALVQRVDWHSHMADIIRAEPVPEDK
jgi:hypothetical protein